VLPDKRPAIPIAVVGCDFRISAARERERLLLTREKRAGLVEELRRIDPHAGLVVLETCNRVEWIVTGGDPEWMAELLAARMEALRADEPGRVDRPYALLSDEAARHLLRVVTGMESMAAGEGQVARQFQRALRNSIAENAADDTLKALGSAAGRIAKAAAAVGFRSSRRAGIHTLVVFCLRRLVESGGRTPRVVVAGMGEIGRRTAAAIEETLGWNVLRFNRTIRSEHSRSWQPLERLAETHADAVVIATGASAPLFDLEALGRAGRVVLDLGIPRQVAVSTLAPHGVVYRDVDQLAEEGRDPAIVPLRERVEALVEAELARLRRACLGRRAVGLLDTIHSRREDFLTRRVPERLAEVAGLDEATRRRVEGVMRLVLREYSNDVFEAIYGALEKGRP